MGSTAWVVNGRDLWEGRDWGRHWQLLYHGKAPLHALAWTMTGVAICRPLYTLRENDGGAECRITVRVLALTIFGSSAANCHAG